jgi:signal transduction histidine kinase
LYAEVASQLLLSEQSDQALEHLHELKGLALDALGEMRLLIFELRPPVLEEEGLVSALQLRLDAVEGRVGLQTQLHVEGDIHLTPHAEGELYRIAQEALNNILKHAQAHHVTLSLCSVPGKDTVVLEISDDGIGFDLAEGRRGGGMGLRGMEERAMQLGGSLTVDTKPGMGTTVRVEVPQ